MQRVKSYRCLRKQTTYRYVTKCVKRARLAQGIMIYVTMQLCNSSLHIHGQRRGVLDYCWVRTRLDGARGKKQVWRPHFRTWGLPEANVLYWRMYVWHSWDFLAPPEWFDARVIAPPCPFITSLLIEP